MLAINLAHSQKYDDASIAEIFKKYADHLYSYVFWFPCPLVAKHLYISYSKGDYDGAIDQYIRTIGELEPSYVIRKVGILMTQLGDRIF